MASTLHTLQAIWHELPGLLSDRVELLTLELQRAGQALRQVVMLVLATAIAAATAWVLLWACVVAVLVEAGLALPWALVATVVFNLLCAWRALARARCLLPRLLLPGTRRHLKFSPSTTPTPVPDVGSGSVP